MKDKQMDFYSYPRAEMLEFIPSSSRRILDVGCGDGSFGAVVKQKVEAEVWGVEINTVAARLADRKIDKVVVGDINILIDNLPKAYFECVVFNDLLEHIADPFNLLVKTKNIITEDGVIVCSLPNVRYFEVLIDLLIFKQWRYTDRGILDKTHLMFFTKKSIEDSLKNSGFEILKMKGINAVNSLKFDIFNLATFGIFNDTKYFQFACVFKPKKI